MHIISYIIVRIFPIFGVSMLINIVLLYIYRSTRTNEIGNVSFRLYSKIARLLVVNTLASILLLIIGVGGKMFFIYTIKQEILASIHSFKMDKSRIYVNNELVNDPLNKLDAFRNIDNNNYHHSSPMQRFDVKIVNLNDSIIITLKRDSNIKNEYWLYDNRYELTQDHELGKIITNAFDNYLNE
jgi:hypothetical protein